MSNNFPLPSVGAMITGGKTVDQQELAQLEQVPHDRLDDEAAKP